MLAQGGAQARYNLKRPVVGGRVAPETAKWIEEEATRRGLTKGEMVEECVETARKAESWKVKYSCWQCGKEITVSSDETKMKIRGFLRHERQSCATCRKERR